MTATNVHSIRPADVLRAVRQHPLRWLLPLVLLSVGGVVFAALRPRVWEATQALIVRDDAVGNLRPGKFNHAEEMKTVQETVLELIKGRSVLAAALTDVGQPDDYTSPEPWPSPLVVEALQQSIKLTPPKGAEFGKTEIFYLKVPAPTPQRAVALSAAICRELEKKFDELRYKKYQSVINELNKTLALAQEDLDSSTNALTDVERLAGPDLAELRSLNEAPTNESGLRRMSTEIETELRTYRASVASNEELLQLLQASLVDPGRLLASPSRLLESQPGLRRLKDGLVDAQLRTAQLLGNMAPDHPAVVAAQAAEQEIGQHLHDEIGIAIKGLQLDLRLANQRVAGLEAQRTDVQARLNKLADVRAAYSNLVVATKHRGEILKTAQLELSEARAGQAAANTASLITLIDDPDAGTRPAGPGNTTVVLGGFLAGLMAAAAMVFLTVKPGAEQLATAELHHTVEPDLSQPLPRPLPASLAVQAIAAAQATAEEQLNEPQHAGEAAEKIEPIAPAFVAPAPRSRPSEKARPVETPCVVPVSPEPVRAPQTAEKNESQPPRRQGKAKSGEPQRLTLRQALEKLAEPVA